jgi:CRP-like cAMP-binding protein
MGRNPWIRKMEQLTPLPEKDRSVLDELASSRQRKYSTHEDIISEGQHSPDIRLILSGWACRYKILADGSRQILAFLVPGDLCHPETFILKEMDHSIGTLAASTIAAIPGETLREVMLSHPHIAVALCSSTLIDESVLRARIVDIGRRDAYQRIAHLLCELIVRLRIVGLTTDNSFELPITQVEFADATGLTHVYVNRMIQRLRDEGLIAWQGQRVTITNPAGLKEAGQFSPNYLHLDGVNQHRSGTPP